MIISKENDDILVKLIFSKNGKGRFCPKRLKTLSQEQSQYFKTRFSDSFSDRETALRIKYHIDIRPVCETCGKPVKMNIRLGVNSPKYLFNKYCSFKCAQNNLFTKEKIKNTMDEKYGGTLLKSNIIKIKTLKTLKEKYGNDIINSGQISEVKEKIKNTFIEKYGCHPFANEKIKEKIKKTLSEKYGDNIINPGQSKEVQQKQYITKKKNNTFNSSKQEDTCYELLCKKYTDVIRQYRSAEYPYNCDFYIPSEDLYIEYQGSWTHGFHPFDPDNKEDINQFKLWQSKNTKYYDNAIDTWTKRDVEKRNIAKENKIKYIEIFSFNQFLNWI